MDTNIIKKLEGLAKLKIDDSKFNTISKNLSDILTYVSILQKADLKNMPTDFNASGLKNITVPDSTKVADHLSSISALKNAKRTYNNYFQVEKVI